MGEASDALSPGTVIGDKYVVEGVLGQGGMGVVYRVKHQILGRRFALKVLAAGTILRGTARLRFLREMRVLGMLNDKRIVSATDAGFTADEAPYLVMDLLDGNSLEPTAPGTTRWPVERALHVMIQVCRGVAAAHREGVIHRDLKPANIYLVNDGDETELVKILDFGVAKLLNDEGNDVTRTNAAVGTSLYMSPEQARAEKHVGTLTDVYAIGAIFYELLSGLPPHPGKTPADAVAHLLSQPFIPLQKARPGIPGPLVDLIHRALSPDPAERPASANELASQLGALASGHGSSRAASSVVTVTSEDVVAHNGSSASSDAPSSINNDARSANAFNLLPPTIRAPRAWLLVGVLTIGALLAIARFRAWSAPEAPAVLESAASTAAAAVQAGLVAASAPSLAVPTAQPSVKLTVADVWPRAAHAPSTEASAERSRERSGAERSKALQPPHKIGSQLSEPVPVQSSAAASSMARPAPLPLLPDPIDGN